ncbi:MAG: hypothetical protein F9K31_10845 [Dokdonella sp.]|nr:MAG: hypothetical protein F9K31_10845 [Dokdonella sp.]
MGAARGNVRQLARGRRPRAYDRGLCRGSTMPQPRLLVLTLAFVLSAAHAQDAVDSHWIVDAHYPDTAALARAAAQFDHVQVDRKHQRVRVLTDAQGEAALRAAGLDQVQVDLAASARLHAYERARIAAQHAGAGTQSIPGYACYRTVEETYASMDSLAAAHPGIVEIDSIGPSWKKTQNPAQGYEMRALRITNLATAASDPQRPAMVVLGSIHAREFGPAELTTRFGEWLINNYGTDPEATWLVDHNDFRLVLQANPDGRKVAEGEVYQRKNMDTINGSCGSSPGVDLNRNFPFHWNITGGQGSSGNPCNETFRGPTPMSEPETQNIVQYVAGSCTAAGVCSGGVFADRRAGAMHPANPAGDGGAAAPADTTGVFFDIHSNADMVLWPWGDTSSGAPNQSGLRTLGRRLAWHNGYTPQQSDTLYPTDGTTDDTIYGLLGVPAYTIELDGVDFFQPCDDFESFTLPANLAALRYVARSLHAPYQLPAGPDALDIAVGSDLVVAGDAVAVSARIDDSRFNQSTAVDPVPGTIRNIGSARMSIDRLPWQSGATPLALAASDGAFDAPVETVHGVLDTSALAPGRHLVHVQGSDVAGNAGTPNAAQFDIVDGASVGTLQGQVRDRVTLAPLAARITLTGGGQSHAATSAADTGNYRVHGYPASFDAQVSTPRYLAESLTGVALAAGATVNHDFLLYPACTVLDDDVEHGAGGWTAQSPWVIQTNVGGHAGHAWNTPAYGNNLNSSLTSASIHLGGYTDLVLTFDDRCATESGYDFGHVEYSSNGGSSWSALYSCNGQSGWRSHRIDLPAGANGASAFRLRFRLQSDGSVNDDGWAVDNIRIEGGGAACRAQWDDHIFSNGFDH